MKFDAMMHREGGLAEGDQAALDLPAGRLVREAGIPEGQAQDPIERIGTDWDSLLREADFLSDRG